MFAGLLTLSSALAPVDVVDPANISSALSPFHRPDREGVWQSGPLWLLAQRIFNTRESTDNVLPCRCPDTGAAVAFWGRLDNRADLGHRLSIAPHTLQDLSDNQLILAAWLRWGEALPEQLVGDFAIAIADPKQQKIFLVRDALGTKPLYYINNGQMLAFATTVAALRKIKLLSLSPDPEWIAHYLAGTSSRTYKTAYQSVLKLPPGHCLTVSGNGLQQLRQWFYFKNDAPTASKRDASWVHAYQEKLEEAVRCRLSSDYPLACENSGGLDSGTVTSYAARLLGDPRDKLCSMGVAFYEDKPELILETSLMHKIMHNYIVAADDVDGNPDSAIHQCMQVMGFPEQNYSGISGRLFYEECNRRGIRTLLSGFGGDEAVTNAGGCMLRYEYFDARNIPQLWNVLPGNPIMRALRLGKVAASSLKINQFNPTLFAAWNARWPHKLVRKEIAERYSIYDVFMKTAEFNAPSYRNINDFICKYHLAEPLISTRLESCTLIAASYGVEYRWPLWDARLVQQYLSTPNYEKVGPNGVGRYLHRQAVDGKVPSGVVWNHSRNMRPTRTREIEEIESNLTRRTIRNAKAIGTNLHPMLDEFIDAHKYKEQIAYAESTHSDDSFTMAFQDNVNALRRLNLWLHNDPSM